MYNFVLVVGDIIALMAGFAAAFVIRSNSSVSVANPMPASDYLFIMFMLLPLWILVFGLIGLYHHTLYDKRFAEIGKLFVGSFVGMLFIIAWDYMSLKPIFPSKLVPVYGFLIAFALLVIIRNLARWLRIALFGVGYGLTRIVILGNTDIAREIIHSVKDSRASGYDLVGVIGYRKKLPENIPSFPSLKAFMEADKRELHGIIQTELYADEKRNEEILAYAQHNHVSYRFVPGNSGLFVGNIDVELFRNNIPVIHVRHTPLFGWGRIIKRLVDIVLGTIALIIASPVLALCALIIKISDPSGAVIYTAKRLTRFGAPINIYKFRTFKQAYNNMSPEEGFAKMNRPDLLKQYRANGDQLEKDPRITKIGQFLKATSLDELPQLLNVVKGDISLVGPRALDKFEIEQYSKKHLILNVKSGLTGLALVSGRPGISFEERRKLDIFYVQNWSLLLDLVIMLKTVRVVLARLFRKGARY